MLDRFEEVEVVIRNSDHRGPERRRDLVVEVVAIKEVFETRFPSRVETESRGKARVKEILKRNKFGRELILAHRRRGK